MAEIAVAPCVGAWIETELLFTVEHHVFVAPCVGAWIETAAYLEADAAALVAPCVGAWIETRTSGKKRQDCSCRSLRGSVD